jgi:hypothetical protein
MEAVMRNVKILECNLQRVSESQDEYRIHRDIHCTAVLYIPSVTAYRFALISAVSLD